MAASLVNTSANNDISDIVDGFLQKAGHDGAEPLAIAFSGGPDSFALAHAVIRQKKRRYHVYLLTVDHGLRADSAREANALSIWAAPFANHHVSHHILKWEGEKPKSRIQETARDIRYGLLSEFIKQHDCRFILTGHHLDDQAETFLMRVGSASGVDGLGAMAQLRSHAGIMLGRPFLSIPKEKLVHYAAGHNLPFVTDPTNENTDFARPKLRQLKPLMEAAGIEAARLGATAARCRRAADALEKWADIEFQKRKINGKNDLCQLDWANSEILPEEIALRLLQKALHDLATEKYYSVRMHQIESLLSSLWPSADGFKPATLGGLIISYDEKTQILAFRPEKRG